MRDIVERLAGWESKGHEGDPMADMLMDDVGLALGEIRRLQRENQALREELAEAKIAIGWARDAGLEEAAKVVEAALIDQSSRGRWIASRHAEVIRGLPSTKEIAAAFPFQTEEAKEPTITGKDT